MTNSINSQGNAPEKTDEVGFRKPPRHTQWKKGQSGNPKGRKKREQARNFHDAMLNILAREVNIDTPDGKSAKYNLLEVYAEKLIKNAINGNSKADIALLKMLPKMYLPEPKKHQTKEDLEKEKKNAMLLKMLHASLDKFGDYELGVKKFFEILNMCSPLK